MKACRKKRKTSRFSQSFGNNAEEEDRPAEDGGADGVDEKAAEEGGADGAVRFRFYF